MGTTSRIASLSYTHHSPIFVRQAETLASNYIKIKTEVQTMLKGVLRFGNVSLVIRNEDKWKQLVNRFKDDTVDDVLAEIYTTSMDTMELIELKDTLMKRLNDLNFEINKRLETMFDFGPTNLVNYKGGNIYGRAV